MPRALSSENGGNLDPTSRIATSASWILKRPRQRSRVLQTEREMKKKKQPCMSRVWFGISFDARLHWYVASNSEPMLDEFRVTRALDTLFRAM